MNSKFSNTWIFDLFPQELKESIVSFDILFCGSPSGVGGCAIFTTSNLHVYAYYFGTGVNPYIKLHEIHTLRGRELKCISASSFDNLLITTEGDVYIWNWNVKQAIKVGVKAVHGNTAFYPITYLDSEGKLYFIKLLDGFGYRYAPILIPLEEKVVYFRGDQHNLAVTQNGFVYSWGKNDNGQLGIGSRKEKSNPTKIKSLKRIIKVDVQPKKSLAVDDNGRLYIWGCISGVLRRYLTPVLWSKQEFVIDAQYIGTLLYVQTLRDTFLCGKHVKAKWSGKRYGTCELIAWILELIPKKVQYAFMCKIELYPHQSTLKVFQFSKSFCDVSIITP